MRFKRNQYLLVIGIVFVPPVAALQQRPPEKKDQIRILSIQPSAPVARGAEMEVAAEIEYTLDSADESAVNIGFNIQDPKSFTMREQIGIRRGTDRLKVKVTMIPVEWGSQGRFTMLANIGKGVPGKAWSSTASTRHEFTLISMSGGEAQASSQDAPKKEVGAKQTQEMKMSQLVREGHRLTKEQAASLEEALAGTPDDINGRARLMGYYFAPGSESLGADARIQARRRHILWFIRNHPDSALLMTSEATLDARGHSLADPEGYDQLRKAWIEQTAKKDASAAVLGKCRSLFLSSRQGRRGGVLRPRPKTGA